MNDNDQTVIQKATRQLLLGVLENAGPSGIHRDKLTWRGLSKHLVWMVKEGHARILSVDQPDIYVSTKFTPHPTP